MSFGFRSRILLSGRDRVLRLPWLSRSARDPLHLLLLLSVIAAVQPLAAVTKPHAVFLGSWKNVPYSAVADPAGALPGEKQLRVRPLLIDGKVREWTNGESHTITDRSFVVRRALRLNDSLPGDKAEHWIWQRGPWLMIDRVKGTVIALHLPDYDPTVSNAAWFRDYAAYCGLTASGKQLYAVVAQVAARRPVLAKKLSAWSGGENQAAACATPVWQREPLRVTFQPSGATAVSYDVVGLSAVLVEDGNGNDEPASTASN
jgi:hypothetical protein